ncbi:hypothetical protein EON65_26385 [archaeon]|nr:MAG: hypothetical protein EON65_26385 [archaeon]
MACLVRDCTAPTQAHASVPTLGDCSASSLELVKLISSPAMTHTHILVSPILHDSWVHPAAASRGSPVTVANVVRLFSPPLSTEMSASPRGSARLSWLTALA